MDITAHLKGDLPEVTVPLDGDALVTFKPVTPKQFEDINKKHTREKYKRGQLRTKLDDKRATDDLLDMSVIGWEGLTDEDGPIECNRENKRKLYDCYDTFRAAFSDVVLGSLADERDFTEDLEGN